LYKKGKKKALLSSKQVFEAAGVSRTSTWCVVLHEALSLLLHHNRKWGSRDTPHDAWHFPTSSDLIAVSVYTLQGGTWVVKLSGKQHF